MNVVPGDVIYETINEGHCLRGSLVVQTDLTDDGIAIHSGKGFYRWYDANDDSIWITVVDR